LGELAALAFSNVQDFYNRDGKLVPLDQLPVYAAAAVKKVQSREITTPAGEDGKRTTVAQVHELELHNKIAALRLVGAHVGLFAEQLELTLGKDFGELLREARARIAPAPAIEGEKVAK
jgi:hypothetical protein